MWRCVKLLTAFVIFSAQLTYATLPYHTPQEIMCLYIIWVTHLRWLSEKRATDSFVKRLSQIDARGVNERARDKHDLARRHAAGSLVMEFII